MPDSTPAAAQALVEQARAARRAGKTREAVDLLRAAMAADPHGVHPRNTLAMILFDAQGAVDQAVALLSGACRDNPGSALVHLNLGNVLLAARKPDAAIALHRGFLARAPGDFGNRLGLARALARAGRFTEASAAYEGLAAERADDDTFLYRFAVTAEAAGRRDTALRAYERILAAQPATRFAAVARLRLEGRTAAAMPGQVQVAFYLSRTFHWPILRRTLALLSPRLSCLLSADPDEIYDHQPAMVVMADALAHTMRPHLHGAAIVNTRHGLISKNHAPFGARVSDYICVTSEAQMNEIITAGGAPRKGFWITGSLQMDPLFRAERPPPPFALEPGRPVILYAPTYNDHLSSAPMLGPGIVEALRGRGGDAAIVIKPHPITREHHRQWLDWWEAAAAAHPHVHLVRDPAADLMELMPWADVLVSDVSSAIFAYLALDRPLVLVTNPEHARDAAHYDPRGIEWRWRDVGEEVHRAADLAPAVARALADPAAHGDRRAAYRQRLFGDLTDGRAAERLAARILALLQPEIP